MALRLGAVLPRLVLVLLAFALGTATLTFAAAKRMASQTAPPAATAPAQPVTLVVPDVDKQAYVFAKGILQDAGFAWRLGSGARGFAPYTVISQSPAPGTRVLDTGAPLVTLHLAATAGYKESKHSPDQGSPYAGTAIRLADLATNVAPTAPKVAPHAKPKAVPKPAAKAKTKVKKAKVKTVKRAAAVSTRKPDFVVPGGRKEPADEIPLTVRARRLDAWVKAHPQVDDAVAKHWLYQNSWIVTGARLGWWHGAQALETLIQADERAQRQWGIGARSAAEARAALGFVRSQRQ
jgi:hypothetical protein